MQHATVLRGPRAVRAGQRLSARSSVANAACLTSRPSRKAAFTQRAALVRASALPPAVSVTATLEASTVPAQQGEQSSGKYNWRENWYPVAFVKDIDDSMPLPFTLMGEPIVFWKDLKGEWNCVLDRCPHRLVPLSEGRIDEDGRLECGYHGWAFNGTGACENIPQEREPARTQATASPRACATAYTIQVAQGMLFVLPIDKKKLPATLPELPLLPEIDEPGWVVMDIQRDLPYDYSTLLENVMDVSHVPFTHHLTVGNRKNAAPVDLELGDGGVHAGGFSGLWQEGPRRGALGSQTTKFVAPTLMAHTLTAKTFGTTMTVVYATPISPGKCRLLARFPFKFSSPVPTFVIKNTPRWYNHQGQNGVLEDDQIFLHIQERVVEAEMAQGKAYAQACYMPTAADVYVNAFHKWLSMVGGGPAWAPGTSARLPPPIQTREALLDRYNSHTRHCKACSAALVNTQKLRGVAFAVGMAMALLAAGSLAVAVATGGSAASLAASAAGLLKMAAGGLVGAVVAAAAWLKLTDIEQKFLVGPAIPPRNRVSRKKAVAAK